MKKLIAVLLLCAMALSLAACGKGGIGEDTTVPTIPNPTPPSTEANKAEYDNSLIDENRNLIFTTSDYRIVDETEFGYVIILLSGSTAKDIYKVVEYESAEAATDFIVSITKDGTAKDYPNLGQDRQFFYYKLSALDETYGKFYTMSRVDILKAFGREVTTTAATDDGHNH